MDSPRAPLRLEYNTCPGQEPPPRPSPGLRASPGPAKSKWRARSLARHFEDQVLFRRNYYRAFASSSANALCGALPARRCFLPPRRFRSRSAPAGAIPLGAPPGAAAFGLTAPLGRGGWAGLALSRRSSRGARSKRRMIRFISSSLGASMNAKPLDSWVSGLRMTFTESATRLSATSHALMSSAVTHTGRLPRKTVELIELGS